MATYENPEKGPECKCLSMFKCMRCRRKRQASAGDVEIAPFGVNGRTHTLILIDCVLLQCKFILRSFTPLQAPRVARCYWHSTCNVNKITIHNRKVVFDCSAIRAKQAAACLTIALPRLYYVSVTASRRPFNIK